MSGALGGIGRLPRGSDFASLLRRGRRQDGRFLSVIARKSGLSGARMAVIAGRVVDKRATARNRMRRRVREYVRAHPSLVRPGCDIAVIIRKEAVGMSRRHFYEELTRILRDAA